MSSNSYRISALLFLQDSAGRHLLIRRNRPPNEGFWSPLGGKLDMAAGESPFECAAREASEETGDRFETTDFHLFAIIAEKSYEGGGHWLMFLFQCLRVHESLPESIDEGAFGFFTREEIDNLAIPATDRTILWSIWDRYRHGFVAMRADCDPSRFLEVITEQVVLPRHADSSLTEAPNPDDGPKNAIK